MKNIVIKIEDNIVTDLITFKINFNNKKKFYMLEIIAGIESNLSNLLVSNNQNKHIYICQNDSNYIIDYTVEEVSTLGVKISENEEDIISYCNCYGSYIIRK